MYAPCRVVLPDDLRLFVCSFAELSCEEHLLPFASRLFPHLALLHLSPRLSQGGRRSSRSGPHQPTPPTPHPQSSTPPALSPFTAIFYPCKMSSIINTLFGTRKTPAEKLRQHQRALQKAQRELDRERTKLEQQEKKLVAEIRQNAKQGQMVRARGAKDIKAD